MIIVLELEVKYLYCGMCGKKPLDFSQSKVNKFLKDHADHDNSFDQHMRLIGYLKKPKQLRKQKIVIHFIKEKEKKEKIRCKYKECIHYSKKAKHYCTSACKKANHNRRKK